MYGRGAGLVNAATGISLLPETGNSRPLFILAISLMVSGVVVFAAATILARKSRRAEAN